MTLSRKKGMKNMKKKITALLLAVLTVLAVLSGCNAAGNAKFETNHLGLTNVTVGKWLGTDGELVSFENYNWKVHFLSVTGKVIYTQ